MSFALLGLGLAFALFTLASSGLSLAVGVGLPAFERAAQRLEPRARASFLFALGVLPSLGGALLSLGLVIPAWLAREPRDGDEQAGPVLLILAAAGMLLVLFRLASALRDGLRTAQTVRRWVATGLPLGGLPLVATRFPHEFPVAAVAGFWRPRLLLADCLVNALLPEELQAVVAHELSHVEARDTLRRLVLRAMPDPLSCLARGVALRRSFEEATEAAADAAAAQRVSPLCLAQALVKVAALVPPGRRLELSLATLHREGVLAARVRALLHAHDRGVSRAAGAPWPRRGAGAAALAALTFLVVASCALPVVHRVLEGLVHLLS